MGDERRTRLVRWRLILGTDADPVLGDGAGLDAGETACDGALEYLYDREYAGRNVRRADRGGSLDSSQLTVPEWINQIHTLFPRKTVERLEKDAVERYGLEEMVTRPEVLRRVRPNMTLAKAVLRTRHLMNEEVLAEARRLVRRVVDELMERLARPLRSPFFGALDPRHRSNFRIARNFDPRTTIRRNLRHWDPEARRIFIEKPCFVSRVRRHADRWRFILLVDQSGSMLGSVIHSAVTAAIFFSLPHMRTHLCLFDTEVADITAECTDPVATLMKVQLGGGTDVGRALEYAASLVDAPQRTMVVLVSDFVDAGPADRLLGVTRRLVESGVRVLGLAALDPEARPDYDRGVAARMAEAGVHVAAMTPSELAEWVAEKVR
ncbi:MAG: VWA domain-containing protein [bacterium]|nr:VWA domain-containing protein [bacterium]